MKIKIKEEKDNPVLKRRELLIALDYEGGATPTKEALRTALAGQIDVSAERIFVNKILSEVGKTAGTAWIHVYERPELVPVRAKVTPKTKPEKKKG
jgi:small subunit ribosomal protein S24e